MASFAGKSREEIIQMAERAKARAAGMEKKSEATMNLALNAVEIGATSFGFGYMRGRYADASGKWEVFGVPPDLLAAVVLHGLAFMGSFEKYAPHAHNVANGALASYLNVMGTGMGAAHKQSASPMSPGALPPRRIHPSAAAQQMRYARAAA